MKLSTKELILVSLFTALTSIGALISISLGEIPVTMQTIFVLLSGIILGPKLGPLSQIIYLILGLIGVPIFSSGMGGLQYILKPSFGFIIGFIFASYITGSLSRTDGIIDPKRIPIATVLGSITTFIFGIPYMYFILNVYLGKNIPLLGILNLGLLPFIPGDILKIIGTIFISNRILKLQGHIFQKEIKINQ